MSLMQSNKARLLTGGGKATLLWELSHSNAIQTTNDFNSSREATQHA